LDGLECREMGEGENLYIYKKKSMFEFSKNELNENRMCLFMFDLIN